MCFRIVSPIYYHTAQLKASTLSDSHHGPALSKTCSIGREVPYELEWASVYTFACLRMERFTHGRVFFAGDAAHGVSPFGARGANSGVQDAENLAWKLDAVLRGRAPRALLATYGPEREVAADENILNSTRATDFITPKSAVSKLFRNAALQLARTQPFARKLVNSGRLSVPAFLVQSALNTPDGEAFAGNMVPGAPMDDAPVRVAGQDAWLLDQLGNRFVLMVFVADGQGLDPALRTSLQALAQAPVPVRLLTVGPGADVEDAQGLLAKRYDARPGTAYLIRPDQHVAARWRRVDVAAVQAALARATAQSSSQPLPHPTEAVTA